jgi:ubiquinone/menaquinone biosynthesis C-methylase UbiE
MDHADHVRLLRKGVASARGSASGDGPVWADLGAGGGAFTLALGELLPASATIHAVDKDAGDLALLGPRYARLARRLGGAPRLMPRVADFTFELGLHDLDGIVMANSLHFIKEKRTVLSRVRGMLKDGAPLLLVENDADRGNAWVPYPLSFETWRGVAVANGFSEPELLDSEPSRFLGRIYSAAATRI